MGSVLTLSLARPTLRRRAPLVLGVWLLAWFVLALQPCCEAIAALAEAPVEHSYSNSHHPLADVPEKHPQCVVEGPAQSAPAAVGGGVLPDGQSLDKPVSPVSGPVALLHGTYGPRSAIGDTHRTPAGNQQYLLTARLRI